MPSDRYDNVRRYLPPDATDEQASGLMNLVERYGRYEAAEMIATYRVHLSEHPEYNHDAYCPRCRRVRIDGLESLASIVGYCQVCGIQWTYMGGHMTDGCPYSFLCACGNRHNRERAACVQCPACRGMHRPPECCDVPLSTLVSCVRCMASHSPPVCGQRLPSCSCRSHEALRSTQHRRQGSDRHRDINSYSFTPDPLLFRGTDSELFLGMELEVEINEDGYNSREDVARAADDIFGGLVYVKEDGSLDYGVEIVTHPMTFRYFMDHFPWEGLGELDRMGCRSTSDTGIHVHMSRAGFGGPIHIYNFMKLWYRNETRITRLAHRNAHWGAFRPDSRDAIKYSCKGQRPADGHSLHRYSALNTYPADTIEARVFRSSLDPVRVKSALGLCDATVEYTRNLRVPDVVAGAWNWRQFRRWVQQPERTDRYAALVQEMGARNRRSRPAVAVTEPAYPYDGWPSFPPLAVTVTDELLT